MEGNRLFLEFPVLPLARAGRQGAATLTRIRPKRQQSNASRKTAHHDTPTISRSTPAMETFNLKTASTYINNLLLARGLLREGKAIEFAHPSRGEGGKEVTMAQVINLVHDLVLKRDVRDCVQSGMDVSFC